VVAASAGARGTGRPERRAEGAVDGPGHRSHGQARLRRHSSSHPRAAASEDDCSCDDVAPRSPEPDDLSRFPERFSSDVAGRCVDMTVPNRILEEVIYEKVVRVTEPDIEGISTAPTRVDAATYTQVEALIVGARTADAREQPPAKKDVVLHADIASRLFSHP